MVDWSSHKSVCSTIKRYRVKLDKEEVNLRTFTDGPWTVQNIFEDPDSIGHFWGILWVLRRVHHSTQGSYKWGGETWTVKLETTCEPGSTTSYRA